MRASVNGYITNLNLAPGTYAVQGKPMMALIDSDSYRVEAYFDTPRSKHSIRPRTTLRAQAPTSPRRKPTMTRLWPARPKKSAPSPTRRWRPPRPTSPFSSAAWKKPFYARPPTVSVIVAEVGENIRAGQPVLAIEGTGKQWLSFSVRPLLVARLPGGPLH